MWHGPIGVNNDDNDKDKYYCPYTTFTQNEHADKPTGWTTAFQTRDHLTSCHLTELYKLTDKQLIESDVFLCRECETYTCVRESDLKAHLEKHIEKRSETNFDIVSSLIYPPVEHILNNYWTDGLLWLQQHEVTEPTFRQSLITKIRWELEDEVLDAFEDLLNCCVKASDASKDPNLRCKQEYDKNPIWTLPFIFEQLILAPLPPPELRNAKDTTRQTILHRIRLFRSGQLRTLYNDSRTIKSKSAQEFRTNPPTTMASAQIAADNDNFKTANARITKNTPIATINDTNITIL